MNCSYENINTKNNDFLENIYGILFYPSETFEKLKQNPSVLQGLVIVAIISVLNTVLNISFSENYIKGWFLFDLLKTGFGGIIKWVFFAFCIELIAAIFNRGGNIKKFLVLSAFALIPWIFTGPIFLFKTGGIFVGLIGVLAGIAIWIWTTILTVFAVMKSYDISLSKVLSLILIPFLGGIIFFNWLIGFFSTLIQIFKF